jgi:hypothetical protein
MRKKIYQNRNVISRYYRKFCNLQKRISLLMRSGEFFDLSREIQHRLMRRLKLLYERLQRLAGKQKLRWAGTAMALILSASVANAQFSDPVKLGGFRTDESASPEFADFDGDGDLDIIIGGYYGNVSYIQNDDGSYSSESNPFSYVDVYYYANPAMADLDNDGDLDLVVGGLYGIFSYFENDAGTLTEMTGTDNPFDGIDIGYESHPTLVNFDGDSDFDLVSGDYIGNIYYFENDGGVFTELTGVDNPFDGIAGGYAAAPGFVDYDEDGDLDLYIGEKYGTISYFENEGGEFTQLTAGDNPFNGIDLEVETFSPVVLDVDEDGDLDIAAGDQYSMILRYLRNDGGTYVEKRGTPNPFEGLMGFFGAAPAFSDMDNDGDLDVLIGEKYGTTRYYKTTSEGFIPVFGDMPFDTLTTGYVKPTFADVDGDSDEDLIIGGEDGILRYFAKEGADDFVEITGGSNPFDPISVAGYAAPAFANLDDDADQDLVIGDYYNELGRISYFRNISGDFTEQTGTDNPFNAIYTTDSISSPLNPAFADIDKDGDMDLFVGNKAYGNIDYYINNGGTFSLSEAEENPFNGLLFGYGAAPVFVDTDEDGDLDLYVGTGTKYGAGQVFFVENIEGPPIAVPELPEEQSSMIIYSYGLNLVVDAGDQNLERIEVYSLSGHVVKAVNINQSGRYELGIPEAIPGLYIVRAYSDGMPTTQKVILK